MRSFLIRNRVIAAATLSARYITDRRLPDKAIDLIDESASRLRMEITSKPQVLDDKQPDPFFSLGRNALVLPR